jgi:hypothetical protein
VDRKQARVIFGFIRGFIRGLPSLTAMVESETKETIELNNAVTIEIGSASYRSTRGYSFAALLCDEIAQWRDENSANPDEEVLAAVRPGMASIPGAVLLCASSVYARRGALWHAFEHGHGHDDAHALVWKAPRGVMNPLILQETIDAAYAKDPQHAAAEYDSEFRGDLEERDLRPSGRATCPICDCTPLATSKSNSPKVEPISAASLCCRSIRLSGTPMLYLNGHKRQRRPETLPKLSASTEP